MYIYKVLSGAGVYNKKKQNLNAFSPKKKRTCMYIFGYLCNFL